MTMPRIMEISCVSFFKLYQMLLLMPDRSEKGIFFNFPIVFSEKPKYRSYVKQENWE